MGYVTAQFRKHGEGVAGFLKEASRSDKHGKNLAAICEGILFVITFVKHERCITLGQNLLSSTD